MNFKRHRPRQPKTTRIALLPWYWPVIAADGERTLRASERRQLDGREHNDPVGDDEWDDVFGTDAVLRDRCTCEPKE